MIKRVDKRLQAVQCLTGNKIKIIACITMLIDHFSKIFLESIMNDKLFPLYLAGGMSTEQFYGIDAFQKNILNGIGTIAFPLFCLLLSEGFFYTKNRKRYIGGMLAFALISEVPFDPPENFDLGLYGLNDRISIFNNVKISTQFNEKIVDCET